MGPVRCWKSSATGGPPTAVAVPKMFETKPAASAVPRFVGTGGDTTLSTTPLSVVAATMTVRVLTSRGSDDEQPERRARDRADEHPGERHTIERVVLTRRVS